MAHAPASRVDKTYAKAVTDLLHWEQDDDEDSVSVADRRYKLETSLAALRAFLSGPWDGDALVHHCPLGCCHSIEESRRKLVDLLVDVLLCRLPPVPALNRWTKLFPAVSWFAAGCLICGILPKLWDRSVLRVDNSNALGEVMLNLLEPESDEIHRRVGQARAQKVIRWINHRRTPQELLVARWL